MHVPIGHYSTGQVEHECGHFLRKDDSCSRTLAICNTLFIYGGIHTTSLPPPSETPPPHPAQRKLPQFDVLPAVPLTGFISQEDQGAVREQAEGQPTEGLQDGAGPHQPNIPGISS